LDGIKAASNSVLLESQMLSVFVEGLDLLEVMYVCVCVCVCVLGRL